MGGRRSAPAAPAPRPAPVSVAAVAEPEAPSEALRRKRIAEGRAAGATTVGGDDTGATKTLLGN
jgi:hypothetical protein